MRFWRQMRLFVPPCGGGDPKSSLRPVQTTNYGHTRRKLLIWLQWAFISKSKAAARATPGAVKSLFHLGADQAVALRRRRLPDPVVALGDPVELAGLPLRPGRGRAAGARCSGPTSNFACTPIDETNTRVRPDRIIRMIRQAGGRALIPGRRADQPVPARGRSRPPVPRRRPAGVHRRLPRLRLPRDAARDAAGDRARRRRSASHCLPARPSGRLDEVLRDAQRQAAPLYNYMNDLPGARGRADAVPAARARSPH